MEEKEWYEKKWIAHINELTGKTYYTVSYEQYKKEDIIMSNKFTEEQYHKVIEAWNLGDTYTESTKLVIDYISSQGNKIMFMGNEALALANPITREWAHEQFVDKRYVWTSKKANSVGRHKRLFWQQPSASIRDYFTLDELSSDESELLTETEVREGGYNPEMFDKEEVD